MGKNEIIVIGGGASGIAAAITAADAGCAVTVLEGNSRPGMKLSCTGNGKCNIGNTGSIKGAYYGERPEFAERLFENIPQREVEIFLDSCGIVLRNENGLLYPYNLEASSVVSCFTDALEKKGVKVKNNAKVVSVKKDGGVFRVRTADREYCAGKLIMAAGSCASDISGADGSGYDLSRSFLHRIVEPYPSLVPLICKGDYFGKWAGVRVNGKITLYIEGKKAAAEEGVIQLTNYGISGIAVFNISAAAASALRTGKKVTAELDMAPDIEEEMLKRMIIRCGLKSLLPRKLAAVIKKRSNDIDETVNNIKRFTVEIIKAASMSHAQTVMGGVDTASVKDNMESSIIDGLYFAGEILDISGKCGGYNLQFAFASGIMAGRSASDA